MVPTSGATGTYEPHVDPWYFRIAGDIAAVTSVRPTPQKD